MYGVSTGFGSLAARPDPARAARRAAAGADPLARRRAWAPPVEREVVRAMMLLRARTLAMGCSGARPVVAETIAALLNAGVTPVVPEYGSLGASGDLAPLAHCALALIGEGEVDDGRRRAGAPPRRRSPRPGSTPLELTAKEGLALINGTDGMLGMLVLALRRPRAACCASPTSPRRCRSRRCSAPTAPSPPDLDRAAPAARSGGERRQPARAARRLGDRRQPSRRRPARPGRLLAALRARRCTAPRATRSRTPRRSPTPSSRSAIDNPMVLPDGRVESCGNFHGAPLAFACDFLADRRRRGRRDRRAAHRPAARRDALARPAAVPRRGPGRQLRADDRPLHAGGDGGREPAAGDAGERRLAAHQRDAGGPRLDGVGRGAQAAHGGRQPPAGSSPSSSCPRPRGLDLRAPLAPAARDRRGARRCPRARRRTRARPLAGARARRGRAAGRRPARCSTRFDAQIGELR